MFKIMQSSCNMCPEPSVVGLGFASLATVLSFILEHNVAAHQRSLTHEMNP